MVPPSHRANQMNGRPVKQPGSLVIADPNKLASSGLDHAHRFGHLLAGRPQERPPQSLGSLP